MTFLVPYDGSELARAALVRADEYADALGVTVDVIVVIPESERYGRGKGWIGEGEPFDVHDVAADLHREVVDLSPDASFRWQPVDGGAAEGTVATVIRRTAVDVDADVVFLGSEDAGRIVVPVSSVGGTVAADARYDVHIVRHRAPPRVERLHRKSAFYATD